MGAADLETVLEACSYIFEQAAYQSISADKLGKHLNEAGMGAAQVASTVNVWATGSSALTQKLRERTLGGPKVLSSSSWRMQLEMGQSGLARVRAFSSLSATYMLCSSVIQTPSSKWH